MEDVTGEDIDHIECSKQHKDLRHYSAADVKWIAKTQEQLGHPPCRALALGGGAGAKVQL